MHCNLALTLILIASCNNASASPFHRAGLVSPSMKALHLRGGHLEDGAAPPLGNGDGDVVNVDVPVIGEDIIAVEGTMEEMAVVPPSSEPTMQRLSNRMASYRQPASPETVESLLENEVVPPPVLHDGNMAMIATSVAGLKNAFLDALVAYPLLKYVLGAFAALVVITVVKGIFSEETEVPPTSVKAIAPAVTLEQSKPKYTAKINAGNPQMLASVLIGGLGMIAGSLAMVAESAESGFANTASSKGKRGVTAVPASPENTNGEDTSFDLSSDDVKKVGAGAAGGAFASGLIGRSVVIGKILSVMF